VGGWEAEAASGAKGAEAVGRATVEEVAVVEGEVVESAGMEVVDPWVGYPAAPVAGKAETAETAGAVVREVVVDWSVADSPTNAICT